MADLYEVIEANLNKLQEMMYTTLPAKIVKVYEVEGTTVIDAELLINRVDSQGISFEEGVLQEVPIVWPSGGGFRFTTPIEAGDNILLHFSMKSLSKWKNSDGSTPITPVEQRRHSINDAFAVPCIQPLKKGYKASTDALSVGNDDVELRITKDGSIELGKGALEAIIKGNAFKTYLDGVIASLTAHTHPVSGTLASASPQLATLPVVPANTLSEVSKTL